MYFLTYRVYKVFRLLTYVDCKRPLTFTENKRVLVLNIHVLHTKHDVNQPWTFLSYCVFKQVSHTRTQAQAITIAYCRFLSPVRHLKSCCACTCYRDLWSNQRSTGLYISFKCQQQSQCIVGLLYVYVSFPELTT